MQTHRPILTQHRLQRLILWALAMLSWIAATLLADHSVNARHRAQRGDISFAWLTRLVTNLIFIRATQIGRFRRRPIIYWRHGRDLRRRHLRRSLLGSRLRRALKRKGAAEQIAQLIAVLRNLDAHAARLAHNVRHRRRLWRNTPAIAPADALRGRVAFAPALADSS